MTIIAIAINNERETKKNSKEAIFKNEAKKKKLKSDNFTRIKREKSKILITIIR